MKYHSNEVPNHTYAAEAGDRENPSLCNLLYEVVHCSLCDIKLVLTQIYTVFLTQNSLEPI